MQVRERLLLLLNDGAAEAQPTFQERKARELAQEREPQDQPREDLDETPSPELESEQIDGESQDDLPGEEGLEEEGEFEEDLDDEIPYDDDTNDDEQDNTDWEKRYKDTQAELTRVNESRSEESAEFAEMSATATRLRHNLEDRLNTVEETSGFLLTGLDQQISQMEAAFSQGRIDPEQMGAARQRYNGLVNTRTQMQQHLDRAKQAREDATNARKEREAEITRIRIRRVIPDWSREKYQQLGAHAQELGFSQEEFADLTDYRMFQLINDSLTLRSTGDTVEDVKRKRKAKPPRRGRNARRQPRNEKGRFEKSKRAYREEGGRANFREMKARGLAAERKGR